MHSRGPAARGKLDTPPVEGRRLRHRRPGSSGGSGARRCRLLAGIVLIAAAAASATPTPALDQVRAAESTLKAAYLYQLANFVDWPADREEPAGPVRLCVLGDDPFGDALEALEEQKAKGRELTLERFETVEETGGCHVLFIGGAQPAELAGILDRLRGESVLTVGDSKDFARCGGMIGLVVKAERLRMEINLGAAEEAGLRISAKLLELSQIVKTKKKNGMG